MRMTMNNLNERYLDGNPRMSGPERAFQNEGYLLLAEELPKGVHIEVMVYEWVSFNVPGGRYTPDFMILCSDKRRIFIEVKQESFSKNGRVFRGQSYRDSRSKLRATASLNPWDTFYMAVYSRGGWKIERIESNQFYYPESLKEDGNGKDKNK